MFDSANRRHHPVVDVLGVGISALDVPGAVAEIGRWIDRQDRTYVTVTGVHGVMESLRDPTLRDIHNQAGMCTADGMPMVWSCRYAGVKSAQRVYGPDLIVATAEAGVQHGWSHFFYGGQPGVADQLADTLVARHPGLRVAGTHSPPMREHVVLEDTDVIQAINESGADVVWVALSTPKQERWMHLHRDSLKTPVLIGVGAAFDLVTGRVSQAPRWIQRSGLEWLYRAGREPRRLVRRYARNNPAFVAAVLRHRPYLNAAVAREALVTVP